MSAPLTPDAAMARLRQYEERPAPTWSTASYGGSAAEATLAKIGRTLADEVGHLRVALREACDQIGGLHARVAELAARPTRADVLRAEAAWLEEIATPITRERSEHERGQMYAARRLRERADEADADSAPLSSPGRRAVAGLMDATEAESWNEAHPVGTRVVAYPGCRPEDDPKGERLDTVTRSQAWVLGGHTPVVMIDGHSAAIALTHVDPADTEAGEGRG
ncbi:hypothetical protein [Streptomyces sp. MP131-18]|uniref:hypothetical protein n=1 Tax=Streptomyces sp. MP131-18 TaxID=1857892 RepID=UPI0009CDF6AB|nr:hypothetical protein [Streptomyces sp. MP131-18]ONK09503.1 hypothetical protein STBA_02030 [Streptomyces sp. MP131-18]